MARAVLVCAVSAWASAQAQGLEVAVRAEEGVRAIKRLQNSYSQYMESGLWDELADLFTDRATVDIQGAQAAGKKNLRRFFMQQAGRVVPGLERGQLYERGDIPPAKPLYEHLILQPIVTLAEDGKSAKGAWHEIDMLGKMGGAAAWAGGIYENDYSLQHGVWKISAIHFYQQYQGDYDAFGHKAPAKWNIPYHFEARHVGVTIPRSLAASSGGSLQGLAERVRRILDEQQVQNLQNIYGYYLDRKMWDDAADLYADADKAGIKRRLEGQYGAGPLKNGELFDHIMLAPVVTVNGDAAAMRVSQLSMLGMNGEYARWEVGTYENEFVREGGVWKIKKVQYYPRMATDYDLGWARDANSASVPLPKKVKGGIPPLQNPPTGNSQGKPGPVEDVRRELDRAIGFDAVENLNSSYGYYIDESAWDNMADTYAKDGTKEITGVGVYVGPERIRKILNMRGPRGGRTANFFTIHQLTQPVIDVAADGTYAEGRFRLVQAGGNADGSSGSWIGGIYENTAVMEDGEWKFGRQELYHIFNASYRNGWARVGNVTRLRSASANSDNPRDQRGGGITQGLGGASSATSHFATEFPPDRPIRVRQYAFPDIVEPPFHYRNPVSGRVPPELLSR